MSFNVRCHTSLGKPTVLCPTQLWDWEKKWPKEGEQGRHRRRGDRKKSPGIELLCHPLDLEEEVAQLRAQILGKRIVWSTVSVMSHARYVAYSYRTPQPMQYIASQLMPTHNVQISHIGLRFRCPATATIKRTNSNTQQWAIRVYNAPPDTIYRVFQKFGTFWTPYNFVKYWPLFKLFLLSESGENM